MTQYDGGRRCSYFLVGARFLRDLAPVLGAACCLALACGGSDGQKPRTVAGGSAGMPSSGTGGSAGVASGVSGAAMEGGKGGTVNPPAKVVGDCAKLPKLDELEEITPSDMTPSENPICNVVADPLNAGTVYVGTDHNGLYKSTDCGSTFKRISTGRNSDVLLSGTLWTIAIDPNNPKNLYVGPLYGSDPSLYKSTNGGVDWDSTFATGDIATLVEYKFFQDLAFDSANSNHIVITFHSNCKPPLPKGCMAETMDGGGSWRLFGSPLMEWGEGAGPFVLGPTKWLFGTLQDGLFYTSDSGANWKKVGAGSNRMLYKAKNGTYYNGVEAGVNRGIQKSTDGENWEVIPNSPGAFALIGDGERLFASTRNADDAMQSYWTSPEADGMTWTKFKTPPLAGGAVYFAHDGDHNVLYAAHPKAGLFRMVTREGKGGGAGGGGSGGAAAGSGGAAGGSGGAAAGSGGAAGGIAPL